MLANAGGVLATWLFGPLSPAPRYTAATGVLLGAQVGIAVCAVVTRTWLARENRRRKRDRVEGRVERCRDGEPGAQGFEEMPNESVWFTYVL